MLRKVIGYVGSRGIMLYALVVIIPGSFGEKLKKIQLLYRSPEWNISLPPHITIVPPFSLAIGLKWEDLIAHISKACKQVQGFDIQTSTIEKFENKEGTIYLSIKKSSNLIDLHKKMNLALSSLIRKADYPLNFVPHITLSGDVPLTRLPDLYKTMCKLKLLRNFLCDKIELMQKSPTEKEWRKIQSFELNQR